MEMLKALNKFAQDHLSKIPLENFRLYVAVAVPAEN